MKARHRQQGGWRRLALPLLLMGLLVPFLVMARLGGETAPPEQRQVGTLWQKTAHTRFRPPEEASPAGTRRDRAHVGPPAEPAPTVTDAGQPAVIQLNMTIPGRRVYRGEGGALGIGLGGY